MNLIEVRDTVIEGIEKVRRDQTPIFIESMAYRFHGHSVADPSNYRDNEEVEENRSRDPIEIFKENLFNANLQQVREISNIDEAIDNQIDDIRDLQNLVLNLKK